MTSDCFSMTTAVKQPVSGNFKTGYWNYIQPSKSKRIDLVSARKYENLRSILMKLRRSLTFLRSAGKRVLQYGTSHTRLLNSKIDIQ